MGEWSKAAYKRRDKGEGETFREKKRSMVSFSECGVALAETYLKGHM